VSPLVLLSKPGCHLCEVMKAVVLPVLADLGLSLEERDVRATPESLARYATEIPVLLCGMEVVASGHTTAEAVRTRLLELSSAPS
jgi:hypothetical protein